MSKLFQILGFLVLFSTSALTQEKYFHDLRGIEDSTGTTHLFYRVFEAFELDNNECGYNWRNDIYHLDSSIQSDSLLYEGYYQQLPCTQNEVYFKNTADIAFLNNDINTWYSAGSIQGIYSNTFGEIRAFNNSFFDAGGTNPSGIEIMNTDSASYAILHTHLEGDFTVIITMKQDSLPSQYYDRSLLVKSVSDSKTGPYCENYESFYCAVSDSLIVLDYSFLGIDAANNNKLYLQKNDSLFTTSNLGNSIELVNTEFKWSTFGKFIFSDDGINMIASTENRFLINGETIDHDNFQLLQSVNNGTTWELVHEDSIRIFTSQFASTPDSDFHTAFSNEIRLWNQLAGQFSEPVVFSNTINGLFKKPNSDILYVLTTEELIEFNVSTNERTILKVLPVSAEIEPEQPKSITLHQNYPNPFNPSTVISYQLTGNSMVSLRVFDALGREVAVLVDVLKSAGRHQVTFDAARLASGVYYYVLNVSHSNERISRKMTLIK